MVTVTTATPAAGSGGGGSQVTPAQRYFGVALKEIVKRESGTIPLLVTKICSYITENGKSLQHIGAAVRYQTKQLLV